MVHRKSPKVRLLHRTEPSLPVGSLIVELAVAVNSEKGTASDSNDVGREAVRRTYCGFRGSHFCALIGHQVVLHGLYQEIFAGLTFFDLFMES